MDNAQWSRFRAGLLGFIQDYYSTLIKTDYELEAQIDLTMEELLAELQRSKNIDDFSENLKIVARQYERQTEKRHL